jgi:23S rRNA G2445 N2-methylase RlmL
MSQESRIKKFILAQPQEAVLQYPAELEAVCISELKQVLTASPAAQKFTAFPTAENGQLRIRQASFRLLIELTLSLRCFRDILWLVRRARAGSIGEVKALTGKVAWDLILSPGTAVRLRTTLRRSRIKHSGALEQAVLRVLTEQGYCAAQADEPSMLLDVRLIENEFQLALSLGGETLAHRHYKKILHAAAPMREDLAAALTRGCAEWAAAILGLQQFEPSTVFVPFAGSGTLGFEAALYFLKLRPSLFGRRYAVEYFRCTPSATVKHLRASAPASSLPLQLSFLEKSAEIAAILQGNCRYFAGHLTGQAAEHLSWEVNHNDFFSTLPEIFSQLQSSTDRGLFLPLNPPFGSRLKGQSRPGSTLTSAEDVERLYLDIARTLRSRLHRRPLAGYIVAPTEKAASAFCRELKDFHLQRSSIRHGGKRIYLLYFAVP